MWPFKNTPDPVYTGFAEQREYFELHRKAMDALAGAGRTLAQYEKIKHERRERGENKMKLEPGKYYETKDGIFVAEQHSNTSCWVIINNQCYNKDGWCIHAGPRILRCVEPPPLTLIPGELYAMENGKVERCEAPLTRPNGTTYRLGIWFYTRDGRPERWRQGPRILHRLRVNEHMKATVTGWDNARSDAADAMAYGFLTADDKRFLREGNKRESLVAEMLAKQSALRAVEAKDALTAMPRVTYRNVHSETEACKREVVVPEGFELVPPADAVPGDLTPEGGVWTSISTHLARIAEFGDLTYIRPIKKHFKVTGPGWYRSEEGGWRKLDVVAVLSYQASHIDKRYRCAAKATAEQARILDAL